MKNKNIDRLFQEKIKDLEAVPSSRVWTGIESKLQKKKRRIVPLWWVYGGVASLIVLSILLYSSIDNNEDSITPKEIITTTPDNNVKKTDTTRVKTKAPSFVPNQEEVVVLEKKKSKRKTPNTLAKNTIASKAEQKKNKKENSIPPEDKELKKKKVFEKIDPTSNVIDSIRKKEKKKDLKLTPKKDLIALVDKDSTISNKTSKKWSLTPVFAVLKSNSNGDSPISTSLSGSPIEGNNTFSYGVKINYAINSKWTIQTGIHLQKMRFTTKNIALVSSSSEMIFNNINSNSTNINSNNFLFVGGDQVNSLDAQNLGASLISNNAILNQSFNYLELPIEVTYRIISGKKLNTHIIGGFSSLFLSENRIDVESENFSQVLGEASNLNSINFSGNFGFSFDYTLTKKWILNINPMMKIHLNTFSENSNNFNPFFLGIYSGIKYSF